MADKRVAIVIGTRVDNVVNVLDGQDMPTGGVVIPNNSMVSPGWSYSGGTFSPPPPVFEVEEVPRFVSALQARLQLLSVGLLDEVEAWANNPATPEAQRIYWQQASHLHRNHTMVGGIAALLGLSAMDVDLLFIEASKLS